MSAMTADQNPVPVPGADAVGAEAVTDMTATGASLPAKPVWRGWLHAGMFPASLAGASC